METPLDARPIRILSGIQPTGIPHLGNYCGALCNWVQLQNAHSDLKPTQLLFSVVDLHALTSQYNVHTMNANVHTAVATFLAVGLDPNKSVLFRQSNVLEHTDLAWRLGCITPLPWLHRMTQYKQKSLDGKATLGLLSYPVLMAADVLLYGATHVPVGDDQRQHLELARKIAVAFNERYSCTLMYPPLPLAPTPNTELCRIMSLRYPTQKMSKSDISTYGKIELTDSPSDIQKKILKAQTDSISGISYDPQLRPGISNLLTILNAVTQTDVDTLVHMYGNYSNSAFKRRVADAVIETICPIGDKIRTYQADAHYLEQILQEGDKKAKQLAADTMTQVRNVMGV